MNRGLRIGIWVLGILLVGSVALYLNESTVQQAAHEEIEQGLQCAVISATEIFRTPHETKEAALQAVDDYCMWGTDQYSIYIESFDVDVTDVEVSSTRTDRTIELWAEYQTGELVPVHRKQGMRGEIQLNPTTRQLTTVSAKTTALPDLPP